MIYVSTAVLSKIVFDEKAVIRVATKWPFLHDYQLCYLTVIITVLKVSLYITEPWIINVWWNKSTEIVLSCLNNGQQFVVKVCSRDRVSQREIKMLFPKNFIKFLELSSVHRVSKENFVKKIGFSGVEKGTILTMASAITFIFLWIPSVQLPSETEFLVHVHMNNSKGKICENLFPIRVLC